jgi:triacylglycerol esterase/lipase EstA (alpha/beta hydrolase family)
MRLLQLLLFACSSSGVAKLGDSGDSSAAGTDSGAPSDSLSTSDSDDSGEPVEEDPPDPPCALDELGALALAVEGDFVPQGGAVTATRDRCEASLHATAGAATSTLTITLDAWDGEGEALVTVVDLLGAPLAGPVALAAGGGFNVGLLRSGEVLVRVEPADPDAGPTTHTLSVACAAGCELAFTRHPLVLMHGMGGTDSFLGLFDYFIDVKEALEAEGYEVHTPAVDAFMPPETRAEQWAVAIDQLMAEGKGRRFNLIAHSQGGIDARYLVSALGYSDRVVSLTTLATPHHGTAVADAATGVLDVSAVAEWIVDAAMAGLAALIGLGESADFSAQLAGLTHDEMAAFNAAVLDVDGVWYRSWSGRTCGALDFTCQGETDGEIVDAHFAATYTLVQLLDGDNDGLVPVDSAIWGEHLGTMPADHLNQLGFFNNPFTSPFDHLTFFSVEVATLRDAGL